MSLVVSPGNRILLVDNQQLFREGLRSLLARWAEFVVVGDAREGNEALELIAVQQPDVVITELHVGDGSGVQHLEEIHERDVAARVRSAGALGYLLKEQSLSELLAALREVSSGRYFRPDSRTPASRFAVSEEGARAIGVADLTERQRQLLRWLALGYRAREIAQLWGVSVKAVYRQRERLRDALQLDSTAALTRFAAREGFAVESDASR